MSDASHDAAVFLQAAIDAIPANVAIIDPTGRVTHVNEGWRLFAELNDHPTPARLVGENYLDVCELASGPCSEGASEVAAALRALLGGERELFEWEYPCHSPREQRWFRLRASRFTHAGQHWAAVVHVNDTARCLAEQARSTTTALFRAAVESTLDAFVLLTPITDDDTSIEDFEVTDANPRAEHMFQRTRSDLVGSRWTQLLTRRDDDGLFDELAAAYRSGDAVQVDLHLPDCGWATEWVSVQTVPGRGGLACFVRDIAARKSIETRLRETAMTDMLTGLPNRLALLERLNGAIAALAGNDGERFALMFLDFDHFKLINDSLGHDVGDEYLVTIAQRLERVTDDVAGRLDRVTDVLAGRLGGDEFIVYCQGAALSNEDIQAVGEAVLAAVSEPMQLADQPLVTSASMGITTSDQGYVQAEQALRDADVAMYHAKDRRRGTIAWFDRPMQEAMARRLRLEAELRCAIEQEQFVLHYQPIINLVDGTLVALEALVRWEHPQNGLIMPDAFVHVAEETGLVLPMGRWVLDEVFRHAPMLLRHWAGPPLRLHVNVAPRQLGDALLIDHIGNLLEHSHLPPGQLVIELTESTIVEQPQVADQQLHRLADLGVTVAMDDFGKGISSLAGLHRLPISLLKIDRLFVHSLRDRRDYAAVIQAVVTLAHNLDIAVVAEGIECAEHVAALQALEADEGQGFHVAEPMPIEQLLRWQPPAAGPWPMRDCG